MVRAVSKGPGMTVPQPILDDNLVKFSCTILQTKKIHVGSCINKSAITSQPYDTASLQIH